MADYRSRVADTELADLMRAVGAVEIKIKIEIRMNQNDVDKAAVALLNFAQRIDTGRQGRPAALIVVTATGSAGHRPDGVNVVPITALAPWSFARRRAYAGSARSRDAHPPSRGVPR